MVKAGHASAPQTLEVHAAVGDIKPWDLDSKLRVVKGRQPRLDGPLKVTGRAKYTFDISMPGMLWGKMVRASVPAAEIVKIDTSKAERLPGVKAVWTTEARAVRFAGQDVAAVAAISPEIAEDAARLVEVTYDERPYVTDLQKAMEEGAPTVYNADQVPGSPKAPVKGNVVGPIVPRRGGQRGDVAKGLAEADVTVDSTYYVPVHTHSPLETHGVIAKWEGDQLTIWASTQSISTVREGMAEYLGIDRKNVTVITEHMGGGFGSKLGRLRGGHELLRGRLQAGQAGGRAGQADARPPRGAPLHRQRAGCPHDRAPGREEGRHADRDPPPLVRHGRHRGRRRHRAGPSGNLYANTPNCLVEEHDVFTNAGPAAPLRAPGHSQGAFALESAIDELAEKLGMDPLELRRKNESSPVRRIQYDIGAKAIGWERRNKKAGRDAPVRASAGSEWPTATGTSSRAARAWARR